MILNYCLLPSGLRLFQIYLYHRLLSDDLGQLEVVRRLFSKGEDDTSKFDGEDRACLEGRAEDLAGVAGGSPDLVIFASAYWPLQHFAGSCCGDVATPLFLPDAVVEGYYNATTELLTAARSAFPHAQLAVHTSPGLRTSADGANVEPASLPRIWGRKSYFAQLNAALRAVAAVGHAKLLDLEVMAASMTHSPQLTLDDLHPRSFFSLEALNVMLNMVASHKS